MFFYHHLSITHCLCNSREKFTLTTTSVTKAFISDTRWACRHGAVNAMCCTFDIVTGTLSAVVNGNNGIKSAEARGMLLQVSSFRFVLCLVIFDRILSCTKSLSYTLQSTQLDLARAADLVSATIADMPSGPQLTGQVCIFSYKPTNLRRL